MTVENMDNNPLFIWFKCFEYFYGNCLRENAYQKGIRKKDSI
jgi:hypothetical protein